MKRFSQQLHSHHSAEDTWEALRTPIWQPVRDIIYPRMSVSYICLDADTNLLQENSRTIIRPATRKLRSLARSMQLPESVSAKIDSLTDNERIDIFTDNQVVEGYLKREVRQGVGGTSLLVVEGEFSLKGVASLLLGASRIASTTPEQMILESNQRVVDLTPQILAAHADIQSQRHDLVSNSA